MKRGVLLPVLLAALVFVAAGEDIESHEHWKAEALKLKAALRASESTNEAHAVKLKAAETAINAWKLKAQRAEESCLGETQITSPSAANASGPSVAQGWGNYEIVSDHWKNKTHGARSFFHSKIVARWETLNPLAFGYDTVLHFRDYASYDGDQKFSSTADCTKFYNKKVEAFGKCGDGMGGNQERWKKSNCPDFKFKPAPCTGTFSKAMNIYDYSKKKDGFKDSATATARYEQRTSKLDNSKHSFYTISNKGKAADGSSDCKADAFVRIGACKGCCCANGLIQYEIQNEDLSNTKNCKGWFMTAVAAASNFFGMWRLEESIKKVNACAGALSTCKKEKVLGESHNGRKHASVWSKEKAWQCLSSSPSRSGNCYSNKVNP